MNGDSGDWPKISVVTPSFNQGRYIEATIKSVVEQGYPNLEYLIMDGGSTDGTVEIIEKYSDNLTYWVSEPDEGQTDALIRGSTGRVATSYAGCAPTTCSKPAPCKRWPRSSFSIPIGRWSTGTASG